MQTKGVIHRDIKNSNIFLSIPGDITTNKNFLIPFLET